jgi:hypothetical protein
MAVSVDDMDAKDRNSESSCGINPDGGKRKMSKLLERLLMWIADALDRSLLTVPEVDDEWPTPVGRPWPAQAGPAVTAAYQHDR